MRRPLHTGITPSPEMAESVKADVKASEYASESEAVHHGLLSLQAHDRAVENWLMNRVSSTFDALKEDPARAVSIESVRQRLATEHGKAL